eukprot:COSAG01_NODE_1523_length_10022_cov_6.693339_6_plen_154_part_00
MCGLPAPDPPSIYSSTNQSAIVWPRTLTFAGHKTEAPQRCSRSQPLVAGRRPGRGAGEDNRLTSSKVKQILPDGHAPDVAPPTTVLAAGRQHLIVIEVCAQRRVVARVADRHVAGRVVALNGCGKVEEPCVQPCIATRTSSISPLAKAGCTAV